MKKYILIYGLGATLLAVGLSSCSKKDFEENYRDPSKVTETTVEKQLTGLIYQSAELVVPSYWNYFVMLRTTVNRYTQAVGWANEENQLIPGSAATTDRWAYYYRSLAQYREFEKLYNALSEQDKENKKIYSLAAKIFFYDLTQQTVDLYGSIPWSKAGMLSTNSGDYTASYAPYDAVDVIYTTMLDELKSIADQLNAITINSLVQQSFTTQDLINNGSLSLWKKYCNSLRLRMLTRVSGAPAFSSRASTEIAAILANPTSFPLVTDNADIVQIDVFNPRESTPSSPNITAFGFRDGLESAGWYSNIASKVLIDNMKTYQDPRLPFIFEPGANAGGAYNGLDQSLGSAVQTSLMQGGTIAIYNRSTYSRNQYFPGILISPSEVHFLIAEYRNKNGNTTEAKTAFENAIKTSITMYQNIRAKSNDATVAAPAAPSASAINTFISNLNFDGTSNKLQLIQTQKWVHFNLVQPMESWAEIRRTGFPVLAFTTLNSDVQKTVAKRWSIPSEEISYNPENFAAVSADNDINKALFWDIN